MGLHPQKSFVFFNKLFKKKNVGRKKEMSKLLSGQDKRQVVLALIFLALGVFFPVPEILGLNVGVMALLLAGLIYIIEV